MEVLRRPERRGWSREVKKIEHNGSSTIIELEEGELTVVYKEEPEEGEVFHQPAKLDCDNWKDCNFFWLKTLLLVSKPRVILHIKMSFHYQQRIQLKDLVAHGCTLLQVPNVKRSLSEETNRLSI